MSKVTGISIAENRRIKDEMVMLLPFSNLDIWDFCTPTFSPSCSCVRFLANLASSFLDVRDSFLIPKISDFCAQRINIDDVMPVEFYFFVPLTLSTKDHECL